MSFKDRFGDFPRIETRRLVLREVDPERDQEDQLAIWGDPEVVKWMPDKAQTTLAQARGILEFWRRCWYEGPWILAWEIGLKEHGERYIGGIRYVGFYGHEYRIGELGYELHRQHWGRGYMTEALNAAVDFGFDRMGLNRVQVGMHPDNMASRRVAEKAGFQAEGVLRDWVFDQKSGHWRDERLFSILRRERARQRGLPDER